MADITGGIDEFTFISIGVVRGSNSLGIAAGDLTVTGGPVNGDFLNVGVSEGLGSATGTLALDEVLATITDTMTLGGGSTLRLAMDGTNRGTDYAAIDADLAFLAGSLEVDFTFQPVAGVFDLIISGSSSGIVGDFTSLSVTGLAAGTMYTSGIVLDSFGSGDVEVYRLTIGDVVSVPEPGTHWLLAFGLLTLVSAARIGSDRKATIATA